MNWKISNNISAELRDGLAVVSVEFEFNSDADEKYDEVIQQVNSIRSSLPEEILQLEMWQWSSCRYGHDAAGADF